MAKHIPYKDRPLMRIEGLLIDRQTVRLSGESKYLYVVQKGNTKYNIYGEVNQLDGLAINDRGVFDCVEKQAISFKYKRVKLSDKDLKEQLGVKTIEYNKPASDPSVFKRETIKNTYIKLVGINKSGFNFENQ